MNMLRPGASVRVALQRATVVSVLALGVGSALVPLGPSSSAAGSAVGLGTASSFAVLAGSTVTNTGPSMIDGDLGVSPGSAITGFPPGTVRGGTIQSASATAAQAQADLTIAYDAAAAQAPDVTVTADLGGQSLLPGVYSGSSLSLTGTLTLDAGGNPGAVFLFQSASTFVSGSTSRVLLVNGANACNVFFQVGSSATLGTGSSLVGTFLVRASITATTGSSVLGRLLARSAAVTLDANLVSLPTCSAPPAPIPSSAGPTPSTSPSPTPSTSVSPTPSVTFPPPATPTAGTTPTPVSTASQTPRPVGTPVSSAAPAPSLTPAPTTSAPAPSRTPVPTAPVPTNPVPTAPVPTTPTTLPNEPQTAGPTVVASSPAVPDSTGSAPSGGRPAGAGSQVTRVPLGGVQAGGGSTAGLRHRGLLLAGVALVLAAGLGLRSRRRPGEA